MPFETEGATDRFTHSQTYVNALGNKLNLITGVLYLNIISCSLQ
jgi:hypothetical protein